jgi:hypothetical protein
MALINTSVPNLIQGVSQQPDVTRFDGQCEEQENALSSVAEGLKKRPNTRHVARLLESAIDDNSFVHFIDRDDAEKYVVIHTGAGIEAWNIISGVKCSINDSTSALTPPSYLVTATPRESLKALTVADNTFIVNKDSSVAISQIKTPALEKKGFVYIAQGDYEKKYEVTLAGNIAGITSTTDAQFTVNVEGFYFSGSVDAPNSRFRIASVDVTSQGEGYPATTPATLDLTINWGRIGNTSLRTSFATINVQPEVSITLVDDGTGNGTMKVDTATVVNAGEFGQHRPTFTGDSFDDDYNASIVASVQGDVSTGISHTFSTVGRRNSVGADSDTANIATSLNSASYEQLQFDTVPFLGNTIFTTDGYLTSTIEGNTIIIEHNPVDGDFTLDTEDGLAGSGIKGVYKRVDALSELPLKAPNNFIVEIVGDLDLDQDNYWVRFTTNSGSSFGEGSWEETVAPNISDGLDVSSMPMTIRSTDINTLEIVTVDYTKRSAGDTETNPDPSFVGSPINDVVFFKNRLGFVTDDSVVFSEAGEFFNFYRTTVSSLLDSAPIDITVSSAKVTKLKSATIFQENLMLFADNVQFVMKGGDLFTPKTVSVSPTTNFSLDDSVSPLALGSYVYFPFTRGSFTGIRELALSGNTETYDAAEITEHVPAYIPSNIIAMTGTTSEDVIALVSANEKGSLYVYNYFWNNNQKVLSAWSKFTFTGEIRGIEFIDSSLFLLIAHNGETNLVKMPLESGLRDDAGYVTHLDMRVANTVPNGDAVINLPYTPEDDSVEVYTTDGLALNCSNVGSAVTLSNPVSADTDVWAGIPYTMKYTFSEQLFKAKAGNGKSPSNAAKLMIRNGSLYYDDSSYFKVKVTPKFRDTYENVFTPDVVGSSTIGSLSLDSGFYRFPVFTKPQDTTITIENDSALPSTFQSAEFESFVHSRSNRYG